MTRNQPAATGRDSRSMVYRCCHWTGNYEHEIGNWLGIDGGTAVGAACPRGATQECAGGSQFSAGLYRGVRMFVLSQRQLARLESGTRAYTRQVQVPGGKKPDQHDRGLYRKSGLGKQLYRPGV